MQTPLDYCTVVFKKEPSKFEKYGTASADLFFKAHVQRVSPLFLLHCLISQIGTNLWTYVSQLKDLLSSEARVKYEEVYEVRRCMGWGAPFLWVHHAKSSRSTVPPPKSSAKQIFPCWKPEQMTGYIQAQVQGMKPLHWLIAGVETQRYILP